jgi:hypothetical protein
MSFEDQTLNYFQSLLAEVKRDAFLMFIVIFWILTLIILAHILLKRNDYEN